MRSLPIIITMLAFVGLLFGVAWCTSIERCNDKGGRWDTNKHTCVGGRS